MKASHGRVEFSLKRKGNGMKFATKFLILLLLFSGAFAQHTLKVEKVITLTTPQQGFFFYPKLTPDGQKVLFTGPRFKGLYLLDLSNRQITDLNNEDGAGYEYQIGPEGKYVYYRTSTFKHYKKYYSLKRQSLTDRTVQVLEHQVRNLQPPEIRQGVLIYLKEARPVQKALMPVLKKSPAVQARAVFVGDKNMIVAENGSEKILAPLGEGRYIWPRLSPDGTKLVFTLAGDATYVCDLDGNILSKIGYANAPTWSPDGQWIAYMVDHDNGDYFTDSEIFISGADGKKKIQVTDTPDIIEMYPDWGASLDRLVFASNRGQIFMATLKSE